MPDFNRPKTANAAGAAQRVDQPVERSVIERIRDKAQAFLHAAGKYGGLRRSLQPAAVHRESAPLPAHERAQLGEAVQPDVAAEERLTEPLETAQARGYVLYRDFRRVVEMREQIGGDAAVRGIGMACGELGEQQDRQLPVMRHFDSPSRILFSSIPDGEAVRKTAQPTPPACG